MPSADDPAWDTVAETARQSLRPVSLGLALIFLVFSGFHLILLAPGIREPMGALALVTSAVFATVGLVAARVPLRPALVHTLSGLIPLLVLANSILHLALSRDPLQTTNFALVVLGSALLLFDWRWFSATLVATGGSWTAIALSSSPGVAWMHAAFFLASATAIALLAFGVRQRAYRAFGRTRAQEAQLRTALQRNAEATRESEARYHSLLANVPGIVYQSDPHPPWRMRYISAGAQQFTGYPDKEFLTGARTWADIIHPDDLEQAAREVATALENRRTFHVEYRILHADGTPIWVLERGKATYGPDGTPLHLDGAILDISARKLAEEELTKALREKEAIMRAAPDLIYKLDPEGNLVSWNPEVERVTGYSREALRGKHALEFFPENEMRRVAEAIERTLSEGFGEVEATLLTKDGRTPRYHFRSLTVRQADGGILGLAGVGRDVTEQRRAEQALRESEAKLRHILDHATNLFYSHTPDHVITYVSPQAREILACDPEEAARRWVEFLTDNPANRKGIEATERALRTGERQPPYELELRRKDGTRVWVEVNEAPVVEDGKVTGIVGSLTDITDRKRSTEALQRTTAQLIEAQHIARLGSWEWDVQRDVVGWSEVLYHLYGVSPVGAPVTYARFLEAVHPEDREAVDLAVRATVEQGQPLDIDHRVCLPDGSVRHIHAEGRAVVDEATGTLRMVGTSQDMTELRESERMLKEYVDALTTFNAKVDLEGRFLAIGRAACQAIGISEEELVGASFLDGHWWTFDPQVHARVRAAFAKAREGHPVNYDERALSVGGIIAISFSLTPILDASGRPKYIVAEGRDINALKQAEERLLEQRDHLESLMRKLQATNKELESFSYSVSHDLKAPLRGIDYLSETLLEDYAHRLDEEGRATVERLRAEAVRMGSIIEDLLELSRITRGELRREPVDLSALAKEVLMEIHRREPARDIFLHVEPGVRAEADARLARVVLENLLGNAWKYTRGTERPNIVFGSRQEEGETVFFVRDNGAGFDMAKADRLFKPFQRLHTRAEFDGTGVGLATVARIVERHGGRIWAEGKVGAGATFSFTLAPSPRRSARQAAPASAGPWIEPTGKGGQPRDRRRA